MWQYITEGFLLVISEMIANCLVSITRVINNGLIGNVKSYVTVVARSHFHYL